jgi:uncharacterized membrane protein
LTVARVSAEQPIEWLRLGWEDLRHTPGASLVYGLIVSAFGALILTLWSHPYLIAASITGFLLVGPLLATGPVELSRRRARGAAVSFDASLSALGRHRDALVRFSVGLLLLAALWMLIWASLIVLLVAFGFATFLVGMVVVFPLLGHATWHAYRDLVQ